MLHYRNEVIEKFSESVERLKSLGGFKTTDTASDYPHLSELDTLIYDTRCILLPIPNNWVLAQRKALISRLQKIVKFYANGIVEIPLDSLDPIFEGVSYYVGINVHNFICRVEYDALLHHNAIHDWVVRAAYDMPQYNYRHKAAYPICPKGGWHFRGTDNTDNGYYRRAKAIRHVQMAILGCYHAAENITIDERLYDPINPNPHISWGERCEAFDNALALIHALSGTEPDEILTFAAIVQAAFLTTKHTTA